MTPGQQMFATVFAAIVGSGILNLIIQHHWEKHSKLERIAAGIADMDRKIGDLDGKVNENAAVLSRTHILRFDDELLNGIHHSKEYFKQQLDDIDTYENYCRSHPDFRNSYTVEAAAHIRQTYERLRDGGEFVSGR